MQSSTSSSSRSSHSTEGFGGATLNVDWARARHSTGVVSVGNHDRMDMNIGDISFIIPSPYVQRNVQRTYGDVEHSSRPNRRREGAQKPGKTATNKDRHFVQHNYHDLLNEPDSDCYQGLADDSFPMKLHRILDQAEKEGYVHIISWQPHGRAFAIRDAALFSRIIMPKYFPTSKKFSSIQRQFNIYGFEKLTRVGPDKGSYYHEAFLRGRPELTSSRMVRRRIKGTGHKACSNPDEEPDFYTLPFVSERGSNKSISGNGTDSQASTLNVARSAVTREESDHYYCKRSSNQQQPLLSLPHDMFQDHNASSSQVQTHEEEELFHFDWSDTEILGGVEEKAVYSV